jgi:hypothetical protein
MKMDTRNFRGWSSGFGECTDQAFIQRILVTGPQGRLHFLFLQVPFEKWDADPVVNRLSLLTNCYWPFNNLFSPVAMFFPVHDQ